MQYNQQKKMNNTITYIVNTSVSPYYKIGKTCNLENRLKQLKGSISFMDIEVVHTFDADIEAHLHLAFAEYRRSGEWFELSNEQIEHLKMINVGSLFTDEDVVSIAVDSNLHLTLTKSAMLDVSKLTWGARDLYVRLYTNMGLNKTLFHFNKWEYMNKYGVKSVTTMDAYIKELELAQMIQQTEHANWYWANPKYLYSGCENHLLGQMLKSRLNNIQTKV